MRVEKQKIIYSGDIVHLICDCGTTMKECGYVSCGDDSGDRRMGTTYMCPKCGPSTEVIIKNDIGDGNLVNKQIIEEGSIETYEPGIFNFAGFKFVEF